MKFLLESPQFSPLPRPEESTNASSADYGGAGTQAVVGRISQLSDSPKFTGSYVPPSSTASRVEMDPLGKPSNAPGSKLDAGKVDVLRGAILYFPNALRAVAHVSELGARKYSWKGWETVPDGINRYGAALARHLLHEPFATDNGEGGLGDDVLHAAEVAWNSLARLELILKEIHGIPKNSST